MERESLKNKAYYLIKEKIITCELRPGGTIDEKIIIDLTGCSRTPVREALQILEAEGLVKIIPRKGIFVSNLTLKDVHDIFELKLELEPIIVEKYGNNISNNKLLKYRNLFKSELDPFTYSLYDTEFHSLILDSCNNKYYKMIMNIVSDQSQRIRMLTNIEQNHIRLSNREHLEIIDSLLSGNTEKASKAMKSHYINAIDNVMRFENMSTSIDV